MSDLTTVLPPELAEIGLIALADPNYAERLLAALDRMAAEAGGAGCYDRLLHGIERGESVARRCDAHRMRAPAGRRPWDPTHKRASTAPSAGSRRTCR
ncbi:MAG: hypothetical protein ACHQDD_09440 [Steroidobacterales bacterium]